MILKIERITAERYVRRKQVCYWYCKRIGASSQVSWEVCRRFSVSAILVHGEVEPDVPAKELVGGQGQGMRVVTKAGGFSTETVLVKSIAYLEGRDLS